ncbi:MAG: hypothetical protein ACXADY_22070 [Candidatus Hodarchaeales archaeon]|jgi:hypothetical protein
MPIFALLSSIFQTFTFYDWVDIVVGLLTGPIPLLFLIRYYNRTKSLDYLILVGLFLLISSHQLLRPFFWHFPGSPEDLPFRLFALILDSLWIWGIFFGFLHLVRFRWGWKEKPTLVWYTGLIWVIILQLLWVVVCGVILGPVWSLPLDPIQLVIISLMGLHTFRLAVGALIIYVYLSESLVFPTNRTLAVKRILILVGLLLIVQGASYNITSLWFHFTQDPSLWPIHRLIMNGTLLIQGFAWTYMALRYPESMLISHAQVVRAIKVYKKILTTPAEIVDKDAILSYLKAIPPETFEI